LFVYSYFFLNKNPGKYPTGQRPNGYLILRNITRFTFESTLPNIKADHRPTKQSRCSVCSSLWYFV